MKVDLSKVKTPAEAQKIYDAMEQRILTLENAGRAMALHISKLQDEVRALTGEAGAAA